MEFLLLLQKTSRRRAGFAAVDDLEIRASAQALQRVVRIRRGAEQKDCVALVLEPLCDDVLLLFHQSHHGHGRRRVDRPGGTLVVKRAVAARDRGVESAAGFGQAAHRFFELPEQLRLVRIAEIQIVRHAQWRRAGASQIPRRFRHGDLPAFVRIEVNVSRVAVHGNRDELFRFEI